MPSGKVRDDRLRVRARTARHRLTTHDDEWPDLPASAVGDPPSGSQPPICKALLRTPCITPDGPNQPAETQLGTAVGPSLLAREEAESAECHR